MSKFQDAMRRVVIGDNAQGQSVVVIDGGPSSEIGSPDLGGLFEIWEDAAFGPLMPSAPPRSRDHAPGARTPKGPFPSALVRNQSSAGGRTKARA